MAKVHSNIFVRGVSGKLGDQVVLRILRDGSTVMCLPPDFSKRTLSKDQKEHHQRFREAAAYAKAAAQHQPIYTELTAGTLKNAYNIALSDWFHAPKIHRVELEGGAVRIHASDNVRVAGVRVMVSNEDGLVLEKGEAAPADENWWSYTAHMPLDGKLKIAVEARDLAGNVAREEKAMENG